MTSWISLFDSSIRRRRILLMLALTKSSDTKEIQRMFYTY